MPKILISVVIPTYNSAATLRHCLSSLKTQSMREQLEIIVVDGGSSDATLTITQKYGAKIIKNPQRLPEPAKLIGLFAARGKYICFLDSDEALINKTQLQQRLEFFASCPQVKMITLDYCQPNANLSIHSLYTNQYGDPFTLFLWGSKAFSNVERYHQKLVKRVNNWHIFSHQLGTTYVVADSGSTTFERRLLKEQASRWGSIVSAVAAYAQKYPYFGIIAGDAVDHNPHLSLRLYLQKLKFRVINNIHYPQQAGFAVRAKCFSRCKAYLFLLYCLLPFWPMVDTLILIAKSQRLGFAYHLVYTYYLFITIGWQMGRKIFHLPPKINSYGK